MPDALQSSRSCSARVIRTRCGCGAKLRLMALGLARGHLLASVEEDPAPCKPRAGYSSVR
jgi:Fe2+ transport system protein FeoA